jgi:ribose transport system substrate-binding protein
MRRKVQLAAIGFIASAALTLAGCVAAAEESSSDPVAGGEESSRLTIGLTVNDTTSFVNEGKEALQYYADVNNIDLIITDPKGDVSVQASQIEQFIRQGVDGIMVIAIQPDTYNAQVTQAKEAGIPLLNINSAINSPDTAGSLEPDDEEAGALIAQAMIDHIGGSGNLVILHGPFGNSAEVLRQAGIDRVLAENPDVKVLASDTANWARDEAANKTANWITAYGDQIDGILAHNDDMGLGAMQAVKEANLSIPVVGIDGLQDALRAIQTGEFIGTVIQNGSIELALGLALTVAIINGDAPENHIAFKMPYVTADDVDVYVDHLIDNKPAFIKRVPGLVDRNLKSGDYSNESE